MPLIKRIWDRIRRKPTVVYAAFRIPAHRIVDPGVSNEAFVADTAYFELRLAEQFIKNAREFHQQFIPLTVVLSEFIYDGKKQDFPFVVGPALLQELEELDGSEHIRYKNTRVAGPIPYRGDEVSLFAGLFRVKTKNWAKQSLSLLESVAKAFDTSKLSSFINVTGPLVDSIEGFLGIDDDMQFRIGQRESYTDPAGGNDKTHFRAGYIVMIREDQNKVDKEIFWVKDNQLYYGPDINTATLYRDRDYILLHISRLEIRNDHTTFDFHKIWLKAQEQLWGEHPEGALTLLRELILTIRQSPDLTPSHRDKLIAMYRKLYKEEKDLSGAPADVFTKGIDTPRSAPALSKSLSKSRLLKEEDIQKVLASSEPVEAVDIED